MKLHESNGFRGAVTRKLSLSLAIVAIAGVAAAAKTNYVDSAAVDDTGDGTSWETAKKTIQAAIDIAEKNDTVLIAKGTYCISEQLTISGKHIELRGATGDPADVVVDAQGLCPCLKGTTSHFIASSMTFENGYSTAASTAGGISSDNTALVTNCIVRDCYHGASGASVSGGGIYLSTTRSSDALSDKWPSGRTFLPMVVDTVVEDCAVYTDGSSGFKAFGGGAYLSSFNTSGLTVHDCVVTNYSSINVTLSYLAYTSGGGAYISGGSHSNDTFVGNAIEFPSDKVGGHMGTGAGVYLTGDSSANVVLADSLVSRNSSHGSGAGVGMGAYATVCGCSVVSNRLSHGKTTTQNNMGGAGIHVNGDNSTVANSLVADNISTGEVNVVTYVGAITVNGGTNDVIRDCVIRDNVLQQVGALNCIGAGELLVSNCVMFGNLAVDKYSTIRFVTNQSGPEKCGMSLITDCYIVSNVVRREGNQNDAIVMQYYGGASSSGNIAAPLKLRNCLFAGNRSQAPKNAKGWGIIGTLGNYSSLACDDEGYLLTFDHCTFAKNFNGGGNCYIFAGFDSNSTARYARFKGCAFWKNTYSGTSCSVTTNSATFANCYADVTNEAFTVTAENGNIGEPDAGDVKFVDADNLDFRLAAGSCLINKGGAFEEWMGDGRKNSVQDMGAGYVIGSLGKYGVTVGRLESKPRRSGSASDIGCSEFWFAPGFLLLVE